MGLINLEAEKTKIYLNSIALDYLKKKAIEEQISISSLASKIIIEKMTEKIKSKPDIHIEEVIKNIRKNKARKEITNKMHDMFVFKNATRQIFNISMWHNESMQNINMPMIKNIINSTLFMFKDYPEEIKNLMEQEKIQFSKLENEEHLRSFLKIQKRLTMKEKENYKPALEFRKKKTKDKMSEAMKNGKQEDE